MVRYHKVPLTYEEQIEQLIDRGLVVTDKQKAVNFLRYCSYNRFSGYCVPFEQEKNKFFDGTTIEQIVALYEFDKNLRMLVLDGISQIEVYCRSQVAYNLTVNFLPICGESEEQLTPFPHLYDGLFVYSPSSCQPIGRECNSHCKKAFCSVKWKNSVTLDVKKSDDPFFRQYCLKYSDCDWEKLEIPIWLLVELISFGSLSRLYYIVKTDAKKRIAQNFNTKEEFLGSWLHSLSYLRNVCAHFSRLWNREMRISFRIPGKDPLWQPFYSEFQRHSFFTKRPFCLFCVIAYLLDVIEEKTGVSSSWKSDFIRYIDHHPRVHNFERAMGIPDFNWKDSAIWAIDEK